MREVFGQGPRCEVAAERELKHEKERMLQNAYGGAQQRQGPVSWPPQVSKDEPQEARLEDSQPYRGNHTLGRVLIDQLRHYLDSKTIDRDNIGAFRERLFMPFNTVWNSIVRDETAKREVPPVASRQDVDRILTAAQESLRQHAVQQQTEDALRDTVPVDQPEAQEKTSEPTFPVRLTAAQVRDQARRFSATAPALRRQYPMAFVGDTVSLAAVSGAPVQWEAAYGITMFIEHRGPHTGRGLHLASGYLWEIVPGPAGIGYTLIARQQF